MYFLNVFCVLTLTRHAVALHAISGESGVADCETPSKCACLVSSHGGIDVTCSGLNLDVIPRDLPRHTTRLRLSGNNIVNVSRTDLDSFPFLTELDLSRNKIQNLPNDVFMDLTQLRHLNLSRNPLRLTTCEAFARLHNLEILTLQLVEARQECVRNLTVYAPSIHFFAASIRTDTLPILFDFQNLTILDLEHSYLPRMSENSFPSQLQRISLRRSSVERLDMFTFSRLKSLMFLDLSCNMDLTFDGAMRGLTGINRTAIRTLILDSINERDSIRFTVYLNKDSFATLRGTRLRHLSIRSNKLIPLSGYPIRELRYLEYLNADANFIGVTKETYNAVIGLFMNKRLKEIHVSWQFTTNYGCDAVNIYPIDSAFTDELDTSSSQPDTRASSSLSPFMYYLFGQMPLPTGLEKIYLVHNMLLFLWNITVDFAPNKVKLIDLSENRIEVLATTAYGLTELEHVVLRNNHLKLIKQGFFAHMPTLKTIELQDNLLGLAMNREEFAKVFENVTSLEKIDLTSNYLSEISPHCLKGNNKISHVNFANNKLDRISLNLSNFPVLEKLNLSKNAVLFLTEDERDALDDIARRHVIEVDLSGNTLLCSCDHLDFLDWFNSTDVTFAQRNHYVCSHNGTLKNLETFLGVEYQDFRDRCLYNIVGVLSGSLGAVTLLVVSVTVGWYRRWHIRYIIYKLFRRKSGPESSNDDSFDGYLAYESRDLEHATQMMRILEQTYGLKICLHDRDAPLPSDHHDAIFDGVARSKKVILLITDNALRSPEVWWSFETDLSLTIKGKGKILCVVKGHLPFGRLNRKLRYLMADDTYLVWPDNSSIENVEQFWKNVALALRSKKGMQISGGVCGLYVPENGSRLPTVSNSVVMEPIRNG